MWYRNIINAACFLLVAFTMLIIVFSSCVENRAGPSSLEAEAGAGANGIPTPAPSPAPTNPTQPTEPTDPPRISGDVRIEGGKARGRVDNQTAEEVPCYLPVYIRPGAQERYAMDTAVVPPGRDRRLATELPPCGCEDVLIQTDLTCYAEPPEIYHFPDRMPGMTLDNMLHTIPACMECPTCTLTCEPPLSLNVDACACECPVVCEPPRVLDPSTCSCGCPTSEPECPEQVFNPETCGWEGDCPCPPEECEEGFTWNIQTCECECALQCEPGYHLHPETCDCWCDPLFEPECPEQWWNEDLCEWEGDCPCEEEDCPEGHAWEGEPVCDCVCTRECQEPWVLDDEPCECECGLTSCDEGHELDEQLCECAPLDICHVSNGGQPGECDWNLMEQPKKFAPGHALHMEPENQCPPDYFGLCDGRYLAAPHPCMLACQPD